MTWNPRWGMSQGRNERKMKIMEKAKRAKEKTGIWMRLIGWVSGAGDEECTSSQADQTAGATFTLL